MRQQMSEGPSGATRAVVARSSGVTAAARSAVRMSSAAAALDERPRGTVRRTRSQLAPAAAPRHARRVSGPAAAVAYPLPGIRRPRRQRAPGRGRARPVRRGFPSRAAAFVSSLPDHRLLDRLIRGRAWIAVLGFALIGIVAMQVALLKLNTGIGRQVEQASTLQRQNAALRAQVSRLSAGDRIAAAGARLGLVMPAAGEERFLSVRRASDASLASRALRRQSPLASTSSGADSTAASSLSAAATSSPGSSADPSASTTSSSAQAGGQG